MNINIFDDFCVFSVASKRYVDELILEIISRGLNSDTNIVLNLQDCLTDYPATPKLIDFFLNHLASLKGSKELEIVHDGNGLELLFLHDLILESDYFKIHDKIRNNDDLESWRTIISKTLQADKIKLVVTHLPEEKKYIYG